ncbi:hypothetical protein [Nocardia sp. XZ_19_369]|uniref:hypothetical protein n=1 Tax=Nocardia sp. XZ_19_369 TaxID=2769487 RepID=UPI0018902483|nr:hypothetical protein [Nocardia sp. XZ_19_369]
MKILAITLDDNGKPATPVLTRIEMQLIATLIDQRSPAEVDEVLPGHGHAVRTLYEGQREIFPRYWDSLSDAIAAYGEP